MRRFQTVLLCVLCALSASCISSTILASGTSYHKVLDEKKTVHDVRERIGPAVWSREYKPARSIASTVSYQAYKKSHGKHVAVWGDDDMSAENKKAALVEVYTLRGPYHRAPSHSDSIWSAIGTYGISEGLAIPAAIVERSTMQGESNPLTVWYDGNGHFVGYMDGDVRDVK